MKENTTNIKAHFKAVVIEAVWYWHKISQRTKGTKWKVQKLL